MAEKILNKCPLCGDRLAVDLFYLCSERRYISDQGELEENPAGLVIDTGRVRGMMLSCSNENCDFETELNCKCKQHPEIAIRKEDNTFYYSVKGISDEKNM